MNILRENVHVSPGIGVDEGASSCETAGVVRVQDFSRLPAALRCEIPSLPYLGREDMKIMNDIPPAIMALGTLRS